VGPKCSGDVCLRVTTTGSYVRTVAVQANRDFWDRGYQGRYLLYGAIGSTSPVGDIETFETGGYQWSLPWNRTVCSRQLCAMVVQQSDNETRGVVCTNLY
jgi:hypothetical protein